MTSTSDRKSPWNSSTITSSFEPSEDHKHSSTPVKKEPSSNISNSGEAQRKFGSAKAISSDQYFGDSPDTAVSFISKILNKNQSKNVSSLYVNFINLRLRFQKLCLQFNLNITHEYSIGFWQNENLPVYNLTLYTILIYTHT